MRKLINIAFFMVAVMFIFNLAGCSVLTNDSKMHKPSKPQETVAQEGTKAEQKSAVPSNTKKVTITQTHLTPKKSNSIITTSKPVTKKEVPKTILVHTNKTLPSKQVSKNSTTVTKSQAQTKIQIKTQTKTQIKNSKPAPTQAKTNAKTQIVSKTAPSIHAVSLSIVGPKDRGMIMKKTKVIFKKGDTILKVLLQATKNHHIEVDYSGSGATAYVNGIDNIYEFDYGAKSGWVGKLNGKSLTKSADAILVKDGDQLEFLYTQ